MLFYFILAKSREKYNPVEHNNPYSPAEKGFSEI